MSIRSSGSASRSWQRVAELHVGNTTSLSVSTAGKPIAIAAVTRAEWAARTLVDWKPLLEQLASGLGSGTEMPGGPTGEPDDASGFLGSIGAMLSPMLLGLQVGALLGHVAQRSLGQYELPVPRPPADELLVVPANLAAFAEDWSIPPDDVRLWVAVSELTHHAVLGLPHVRARFERLLGEYAAGFRPDPSALESQLGSFDPSDPSSMEALLADPTAVLGAMQTPEQRVALDHLSTLVAAVEGYVDHVVDQVGRNLIGSFGPLTEALRRKRVTRGDDDRYAEQLLGLVMDQATFARGNRFVDGIVERAGEEGLARLWLSDAELPTPAEVDAPGLWLARIDLPAT